MDIKKFDSRFKVLPIKKIVQENETTKTFIFEYPLGGKAGQFIMLWIPGIDENGPVRLGRPLFNEGYLEFHGMNLQQRPGSLFIRLEGILDTNRGLVQIALKAQVFLPER